MNRRFSLLLELTRKEIRTRYLENWTGLVWLILQPLFLLLIYGFVFIVIFKARVPEAETTGFLPYLAIAFWPWTAFAESVLRSMDSINENSELIGKISLPAEVFPIASVSATFLMHGIGYLAVLIVLQLMGVDLHWSGLPLTLAMLLLIYCFALAVGLLVAGLSVFLRDMRYALPPLMTLWFFSTPILYSISIIPQEYHRWMYLNPMTHFVNFLRQTLLGQVDQSVWFYLLAPAGILLALFLALKFFRRVSPRFEDFV